VSPDGTKVFVSGDIIGTETSDILTVAYNAQTGAQLWQNRELGHSIDDHAKKVVVSPDSAKLFMIGQTFPDHAQPEANVVAAAYDTSNGTSLWSQDYDSGFEDEVVDAAVSPDGTKLFFTGWRRSTTAQDYLTVAYTTNNGAQSWAKVFDGPDHGNQAAVGLVVKPDSSRVYVTGTSQFLSGGNPDHHRITTIAYGTSAGAAWWTNDYELPTAAFTGAGDIAIKPDGSMLYITGTANGTSGDVSKWVTICLRTPAAGLQWAQTHNHSNTVGNEYTNGVVVSPNGATVFVAGSLRYFAPTGYDPAVRAYNATTGAPLWASRYAGPSNEYPRGITVTGGGSKVVTIANSPTGDFYTVAYSTV